MVSFKNMRNPILPLAYHVPDSEAHVMPDGKLYIYGSFDNREDLYCSEEYHVVSTLDMEHWTIHDISLKGSDVPWFNNPDAPKYPGIDWSHPTPFILKMLAENPGDKEAFENQDPNAPKPALLFAPDCIHKDGKYYLYFCMSDDSEGVAVSDKPEGPFEIVTQLPCGGIDPAIFIDDDGQAYYYWGQLFSHGVKLNDDMTSFDANGVVDDLVTEVDHYFHEGSSMRKIGDTYYYAYANIERGKPTSIGYSTGKSPLGPFTYQGVIINNEDCDPKSWNNHGSIECFNGQWYVFYHRCSRNSQLHRRLCIEKLTINADGTIKEAKMTSQGVGEPFAPGEVIMGYQACGLKGGAYIDVNGIYGEAVTHISSGDEIVFRYVKSDAPWTSIDIEGAGNGKLDVMMILQGQEKSELVCAGTVVVTDGKCVDGRICAPAGEYGIVLKVREAKDLEIGTIVLK